MSTLARIGILGGMSWESTAVYYRQLNQLVHERVGGHASAPLLLWSVDFAEIEALQRADDWDTQGAILGEAAAALERAGVDAVALATNTLHIVAGAIRQRITVPFIDIVDVAGQAVVRGGYGTVGLLATDYTMTSHLYPARLKELGADVLVPEAPDRAIVHQVIYEELVHGVIRDQSRERYLQVIDRLAERGAEAVLLACTEIGLLLSDGDASVPLLDTAYLHCAALADLIITGVRP